MITIDIDTHGLERQLAGFSLLAVFSPAMKKSVLILEADLKKYPAQRSGSNYRRTGTLGRRWTTEVNATSNDLTGIVGNNTPYGPFVQSEAFQASIHKGRWLTDERSVINRDSDIVKLFENAASDFLSR